MSHSHHLILHNITVLFLYSGYSARFTCSSATEALKNIHARLCVPKCVSVYLRSCFYTFMQMCDADKCLCVCVCVCVSEWMYKTCAHYCSFVSLYSLLTDNKPTVFFKNCNCTDHLRDHGCAQWQHHKESDFKTNITKKQIGWGWAVNTHR